MRIILGLIVLFLISEKIIAKKSRPQKQHIRCIEYLILLTAIFVVKYLIIIEVI